jgi:taurine dioxygenase
VNTLDGHVEAREEDIERYGKPVTHPLIRTHPDNGTKAVYFHPTKSKTIEGMTPEESRALLEDLLQRVIQPDVVYRHQWQLGDMVIFDNRSVMHKAHGDYDRRESRLLYRLILRGERPV